MVPAMPAAEAAISFRHCPDRRQVQPSTPRCAIGRGLRAGSAAHSQVPPRRQVPIRAFGARNLLEVEAQSLKFVRALDRIRLQPMDLVGVESV